MPSHGAVTVSRRNASGRWARTALVLASLWLAATAGCNSGSHSEPALSSDLPSEDTPLQPENAEAEPGERPVDSRGDVQAVLAEMDPQWQAMLAEAEALQRRDGASSCAVCHVDAADQWNGTVHERSAVGCVECHGPSHGHVEDENNEVSPDEVFVRADVDRLCAECHRCGRAPVTPAQAALLPAVTPAVCTDCHIAHQFFVDTD
jgi:hypothetical protein